MFKQMTALTAIAMLTLSSVACAKYPGAKIQSVIEQVQAQEVALYESMVIEKLTPELHDKINLYLDNALTLNDSKTVGQLIRNAYEAAKELGLLKDAKADDIVEVILQLLNEIISERSK